MMNLVPYEPDVCPPSLVTLRWALSEDRPQSTDGRWFPDMVFSSESSLNVDQRTFLLTGLLFADVDFEATGWGLVGS